MNTRFLLPALLTISLCLPLHSQTIAEYWNESGYMQSKIKSVPRGSSFVFFTDTHMQRNCGGSAEFATYLRNKTGSGIILFGGDCFDWAPTKEQASEMLGKFAGSIETAAGKNFLWTQGNHDCNSNAYSKYKIDIDTAMIPDSTAYSLTVARISERVMFDEDFLASLTSRGVPESELKSVEAWGRMHYCFDDTKNRIRFIILETGDNGLVMRKYITKWGGAAKVEAPFVRKCLSELPKGYHAVIAGHSLGRSKKGPGNSIAPIIEEACAFNARSKQKVMMIAGHVHVDNAFSVNFKDGKVKFIELGESGIVPKDEVLLIWTSCDARASYKKYVTESLLSKCRAYPDMKVGTRTEHCADVITFRRNEVFLTRFGVGENRSYKLLK